MMPEAGHWDGASAWIYFDDPEFIANNILATAEIFGLKGSIPAGVASPASVRSQPNYVVYKPATGYYNGQEVYSYDANFIAANIPLGISLYGLVGSKQVLKSAKITPALSQAVVNGQNAQTLVFSIPISGLNFTPTFISFTLSANMAAYGQFVGTRTVTINATTDGGVNFSGANSVIDITSYTFTFAPSITNVANGSCTLNVYLTCSSPNNTLASPNGTILVFGY